MKRNITLLILSLLLFSCGKKETALHALRDAHTESSLSYASGFAIEKTENYTLVTLFNPWQSDEILQKYYLVKDIAVDTPDDGLRLIIPLNSLSTSSVTHLEFLSLLGEIERITGACNPEFIYNEKLRTRLDSGDVVNLGDAFSINVERTIQLQPTALMMSGYNNADAHAQRIAEAGVPVIYNNEWMESSPLARAEWIKFVAQFFDKEQLADSVFNEIEERYLDLKKKVEDITHRPKVMSGNNFRGTWYMPGGMSFVSELFRDAGADYFYFDDKNSGSLPLNFETVLKNFSDAEVWLNADFESITELLAEDDKYRFFEPAKSGRVYNNNKRLLPGGANDYWESSVARPDLLLSDYIKILHPELLPEYQLYYTKPLTE